MQGQECEAVIVSYGVSDVESAMNEKEFIYSLNRLNVSITRARTKAIVFLPRPLIEPPMQVYEDDRLCDGVAFMQGLVRFAEHRGQVLRYPQPEAGELKVYRVPAPVKRGHPERLFRGPSRAPEGRGIAQAQSPAPSPNAHSKGRRPPGDLSFSLASMPAAEQVGNTPDQEAAQREVEGIWW